MGRTIVFDSEGNEITPICYLADAIILREDDCADCQLKTDGCRERHNSKEIRVDYWD